MHLAAAVVVGQVDRDHLDSWERRSRAGGAGLVRPVAEPDDERPLVEPERVPALGERRLGQLGRDRHAGRLEVGAHRLDLAAPRFLAGPEQDRARVGRRAPGRRRRSRRDSVGGARRRRRPRLPPPASAARRPSCSSAIRAGIRLGAPPVLAPAREVRARRPDEDPPQRRRSCSGSRASIRSSSSSAPALSSGSFRFPHFGDWTQDGQPLSQGQPSSIFAVSSTQPSKASKPRSVIPTPPEWPS